MEAITSLNNEQNESKYMTVWKEIRNELEYSLSDYRRSG